MAKQTPTLHMVRHAQGFHNLSIANHGMHDPLLTNYGKHQCARLQNSFPYAHSVDLIVASPIKRTIYTALLSFSNIIRSKKLTVIALPELQETSDMPCDTGSPRAALEAEFADQPVDLSLVVDGWDSKTGKWSPSAPAVEARCQAARQWLRARPEKHIVVVTHGGVLHYLTEDWEGFERMQGTGWANTEYRSYEYTEATDERALLAETQESRRRRHGSEKPLGEAEQRNLKATSEKQMQEFDTLPPPVSTAEGRRLQAKVRERQTDRDFIGGL